MKKLLLLMLLLPTLVFGQTFPDFTQIKNKPFVNAADKGFSILKTGVANATALRKAVTALGGKGGTIVLPAGDFSLELSSPIELNTSEGFIRLQGQGNNSTILNITMNYVGAAFTSDIANPTNCGLTVEGISFRDSSTTGRFWGDDATDAGVKVFFIEHFWGNYWKRCSGLLYNEAAHILVKATPPYSLTGVGYTDTGVTPTGTSGKYITAGTLTDAGFIPTNAGGSDSTYFSDVLYYATPAAGVFNVALVGGSRDDVGRCGSWVCRLNNTGDAFTYRGASLSFLKP